ncbi:hypothetical protein [Halorubellus litoreus]|uniref:Uncharacterized protein n=1 Tax=Halorubellus litoreus TaxID=755308 RepID=A0ABD5VLN1_9EURY
MVSSDEELLSLVRGSIGATNAVDVRTDVLREELAEAKAEISREVNERLTNGENLNFYQADAAEKALVSLMLIRGKAVLRGKRRNTPKRLGALRRHTFEDDDERFWRDELVRNLNRLNEMNDGN